MLTPSEIDTKIELLRRFWNVRDKKLKSWYEQIKMTDLLEQKDMESFVSNSPRATLNLLSGILDQPIPHRIMPEKLQPEQLPAAAELSEMFDIIWENMADDYRRRGRYLHKDIRDFTLITGWTSVFIMPTEDGSAFVIEPWNPITVYSRWGGALTESVHIFAPGESTIRQYKERNGWELKQSYDDKTQIKDYWYLEYLAGSQAVLVHNAIKVGNELAKPDTPIFRLDRIPIFTFPVGGLPDTGELAQSKHLEDWKQDIGQSYIATNENVIKSVNKWWSFMMQLLRDTAQAKTFERSPSATKIVKNMAEWFQRGAHFKLGPQDELGYIAPPPIPVELRGLQLDLEAMEQRGGPSWSQFGAVQQRMTAYAMSQVASATNQIARPFHRGLIDLYSDIDNFMLKLIKDNHFRPYGMSLPSGLPKDAKLSAEYELRIPGDLAQRATTARILNPEFILSDERVMAELFPEIKNPAEELARIDASKARKHPIFAQLSLVSALKEEARLAGDADDREGEELYARAAERLSQDIMAEQQEQPTVPPRVPVRPEVVPPGREVPEGYR